MKMTIMNNLYRHSASTPKTPPTVFVEKEKYVQGLNTIFVRLKSSLGIFFKRSVINLIFELKLETGNITNCMLCENYSSFIRC